MIGVDQHATELFEAWRRRSAEVVDALERLHGDEVHSPSALPGWDRLTIVCHLRYGARALCRMTTDALVGRTTSYYPGGRHLQRPSTLRPKPHESAQDVIGDLRHAREALVERWSSLASSDWCTPVVEPADNPDLGEVTLGVLVMAALTENEVHGTDLDLGLADWSPTFVRRILPARLAWLTSRRTNHREYERDMSRSWLLTPHDGADWLVSAEGEDVRSQPADHDVHADATIRGSSRDLLAMLLGRPLSSRLEADPDDAIDAFQRAFPGP